MEEIKGKKWEAMVPSLIDDDKNYLGDLKLKEKIFWSKLKQNSWNSRSHLTDLALMRAVKSSDL